MTKEETEQMKRRSKNVLETLIRALEFKSEPGVPSNARSTALFTKLGTTITAMESHGTDQVSGSSATHSGVELKQLLAEELRDKLRDIVVTAEGLDSELYPGADAQFRMPRSRTYQALLATARSFLEDIGPIKAGFVESGLPADFDEQLTAKIAEFASATQKRDGGASEQIGGTAGLDEMAREGVRLLVKLNAVMHNLLKDKPSMFASWKAAIHIKREPSSAKENEQVPLATVTTGVITHAAPTTAAAHPTSSRPAEGTK